MEVFKEYLEKIENPQQRVKMEEVFIWISKTYPKLVPKIAWNQPMFTDHETFIIGFSTSKQHMALALEVPAINHFAEDIIKAGYDYTKGLVRIKWNLEINYSLIGKFIDFNILDKAECSTFWRK